MRPEHIPVESLVREGWRLVAFRQAAVPVFLLRVRFLTLARKEMKPIPEFVLRSIDAGLSSVPDVAAFLGVDDRVVVDALHLLTQIDAAYVGSIPGSRQHHLLLTQQGHEMLNRMKVTVQEEQTATVAIDGMTRRYLNIERRQLASGADVERRGLLELPATPDVKPDISDIEGELKRFYVETRGAVRGVDRDIAEVVAIERTDRMFRDDVYLLYYRSQDGAVEAGLFVGEQLSEPHEEASRSWLPLRASALVPTSIREALPALMPSLKVLTNGVQDGLRSLSVVDVFRLPRMLNEALAKAKSRLFISSHRPTASVVTAEFIASLEGALKRGVEVYIAFPSRPRSALPYDDTCDRMLDSLSYPFNNMTVLRGHAPSPANVLISDDKYCVVSMFDWLGYMPVPAMPATDELGYYGKDAAGVNALFESERSSWARHD